jgi:tetratricopeptide (TPR) repeat protein
VQVVFPDDQFVLFNLAAYYFRRASFCQALYFFRRVFSLDPSSHRIAFNIGVCYDRLGKYTEASEVYSDGRIS